MVAFSDTKNVKLGVARVTFGGVDLGFTKGGVEVEVTTDTHKVQVDQFGNSDVNEFIQARNCVVRVPLAETTLLNMVEIMPGAILTETGGALATGTIDMGIINAADGDTVTINGVKYTFKTVAVAAFDILVGADVMTTLANMQVKLAAETAPSVAKVIYTEDTIKVLTATFKTKSLEGNSFTLAATGTASGWTIDATLSGGLDSTKRIEVPLAIGKSLLDSAKELILHPIAKVATDLSDDFTLPKANTAGALSFAYKVDEERIFNVEFTAYPDTDTKVLFKVGDKAA